MFPPERTIPEHGLLTRLGMFGYNVLCGLPGGTDLARRLRLRTSNLVRTMSLIHASHKAAVASDAARRMAAVRQQETLGLAGTGRNEAGRSETIPLVIDAGEAARPATSSWLEACAGGPLNLGRGIRTEHVLRLNIENIGTVDLVADDGLPIMTEEQARNCVLTHLARAQRREQARARRREQRERRQDAA